MINSEKEHFSRIYKGLSYEQYTISRLSNKEYEAHKFDVDFAFDILVTNEKMKAYSPDIPFKSYLFQVKSRYIKENYISEKTSKAGIRRTAFIAFQISRSSYEHLFKEPNAFLICYFLERLPDGTENILGEFWLNNQHIRFLDKHKYIIRTATEPDKVYIYTYITTQASLQEQIQVQFATINSQLKEYIEHGSIETDFIYPLTMQIEQLENLIQKTPLLNMNSNTNIYLTKTWMDDKNKQLLLPEQHNLANFDKETLTESPFFQSSPS